jgi:hypothetical protein
MMQNSRIYPWAAFLCLLVPASEPMIHAQTFEVNPPQSRKDVLLPPELGFVSPSVGNFGEGSLGNRTPRLRLFRMPTGFLSDPVGFDSDNDPSLSDAGAGNSPFKDSGDRLLNRVQFNVGNDNPFFDFRRPGDPGGVGYYRLHSQIQLVGTESTGLSFGCQAVSPAGIENDGVADGPTFFSPNVAWFQDLGEGTALHGFVGTHMRAAGRLPEGLINRGFQYGGLRYGMAFQQPLVCPKSDPTRGLYFFVEALGRYRMENDYTARQPESPWELLPGMHWRVNESWWFSGGVVLPNGTPRPDFNYWQITCSVQF